MEKRQPTHHLRHLFSICTTLVFLLFFFKNPEWHLQQQAGSRLESPCAWPTRHASQSTERGNFQSLGQSQNPWSYVGRRAAEGGSWKAAEMIKGLLGRESLIIDMFGDVAELLDKRWYWLASQGSLPGRASPKDLGPSGSPSKLAPHRGAAVQ